MKKTNTRMKKNLVKRIAVIGVAAITIGFFTSCKDNDDTYKGDLDLSLLCLTQARDSWNGAECNMKTTLKENELGDMTFTLNTSLYQNKKVAQEATVTLSVNRDSLTRAIAHSVEGGLFEKYKNAVLLSNEYYRLSENKMTILNGDKLSQSVTLTVYTEKILKDPIRNENKRAFFVLPLTIDHSTTYGINSKVNTLMLFFELPKLDETKPDPTAPKQEMDDMKLVWSDEFNGTGAPDSKYWNFEKGFARNQELQWYQGDNAECKEGRLVITGKKERVLNPNYQAGSSDWKKNRQYAEYTSTSMTTSGKFEFQYGRLLVRAKIPTAMGAWPAIWTLGIWYDWPSSGEIDILEYYLVGGKPHILANTCWGSGTPWQGKWNSQKIPFTNFTSADPDWAKKYHIWRMDWDEEKIELYLDDVLLNRTYQSQTANGADYPGTWPFKQKHYVLLNLAIGANGGTPDNNAFPMQYEVDYVRAYQKAN